MSKSIKVLFISKVFPIFFILLTSSFLFWKFKAPFIDHQYDEFSYANNIIIGSRSTLGLGRPLYISFMHIFYKLLPVNKFDNPSIPITWIKLMHFFVSITTILLFYLLLKKIMNVYYALIGSGLVLSSYTILRSASAIMPEFMAMLFLLLGILLLFSQNTKTIRNIRINQAVFILGLIIFIHERYLLFIPLILISVSGFYLNRWKITYYLSVISFSVTLLSLILLLSNSRTTNSLYIWLINNFRNHNIFNFRVAFKLLFSEYPFFYWASTLLGLIILLNKIKHGFIFKSLLFVYFLFLIIYAPYEKRYFIPIWFISSFLASYFFREISILIIKQKIQKRISQLLSIYFLFYIIGFSFSKSYPILLSDNNRSLTYLYYAENLLENINEKKALFLVGDKSWLVGNYLSLISRPDWKVVWSGWSWNPATILSQIREAKNRGYTIYIDQSNYYGKERTDLEKIVNNLQLKSYYNSLKIIEQIDI